jgi:hypothetical protein
MEEKVVADAKKLIENLTKERIERCRARIEQVLQEENCFIDVAMVISGQGILPQISIKAKPEN